MWSQTCKNENAIFREIVHAKCTWDALTVPWVLTEQTWPDFNQIRYLLSRPLTHPIYVLSGGFPRDTPITDDVTGHMWLYLSCLTLVSQSAARVKAMPTMHS